MNGKGDRNRTTNFKAYRETMDRLKNPDILLDSMDWEAAPEPVSETDDSVTDNEESEGNNG